MRSIVGRDILRVHVGIIDSLESVVIIVYLHGAEYAEEQRADYDAVKSKSEKAAGNCGFT